MGKTTVKCSGCTLTFTPGKLRDVGVGVGGGSLGAVLGSSAGVAFLGTAIAATGPAAIAGSAIGVAASSQLTRCPHCGKVQMK